MFNRFITMAIVTLYFMGEVYNGRFEPEFSVSMFQCTNSKLHRTKIKILSFSSRISTVDLTKFELSVGFL